MRVSSASDLPRLWQWLVVFAQICLFPPLSGVFDLPFYWVMASLLIPVLSLFKHACVDFPTPYPPLRQVLHGAICTVSNHLFLVNTQSLVSGYC